MNSANRRNFLKTAGVGAAAVGTAALVPVAAATSTEGAKAATVETPALDLPVAASGSMVAYVHDVTKGEVSVMVEGREVTITDHQLVAKLAHALHSPSTSA